MPEPLTIAAIAAAAYVATRERPEGGGTFDGAGGGDDTVPDDDGLGDGAGIAASIIGGAYDAGYEGGKNMDEIEEWADEFNSYNGSVPVEFLARWMQHESGGNPCAIGLKFPDGSPKEAGIAQLYFEHPAQVLYGVTRDQLRAACDGNTQRQVRDLTPAERKAQFDSLVAMAAHFIVVAGRKLDELELSWAEDEILCLAKLYHALPSLVVRFLPTAASAGEAFGWDTFRDWCQGLSRDQALAVDSRGGQWSPFTRLFRNAEIAGRGATL